ncbi:hypothetical protein [Actinophytocola gossypii]|uniref:Tat pathway signal sequence domain protein n=1 Tax=Actinophytocola gossypii TaxID=2812003 RepID=A0ABT2J8J7_9PSEU|nr:hypothetical protein [Actinophytocola gossypii]MCT2583894.1 hypothetical protein [Actinophytocola gossypii]
MSGKLSRRQALALGGGALLGAAAGTGTAAAATDWIRLPVVTANIGRTNLGARDDAIHDVRDADPGHRPLVGWQEICEGDTGERPMITRYFGNLYQNAFLWHDRSYRVPLSVPRPWKVVSSRATRVHGGIPKVTPPRWINEVVVRHESHPDLRFALINTHYIANAYNGDNRADLRDEWNLHKRVHKERVLAQHRLGRLVIWTADTNRRDYRDATGWQAEQQVFTGGIDRINWLPGNGDVQLQLRGTRTVPMRVDTHDARVAIFRIRLT